MKQLKATAGLLACVMLLAGVCGCGKQEEDIDLDLTETTASTEADTEADESTEAETEDTTASETEADSEETTDSEEILMTDVTVPSDVLPEESEANDNVSTLPADTGGQAVIPVPTDPPATEPVAPIGDEVTFRFNDNVLRVGDNASGFVAAVPANSTESAPSCYGNGEDINYYYDDFTIFVWNENGSYMTVGIDITGPGVATQKGIAIGATVDDVIAAYGGSFEELGMDYVYTYGDCNLRFTIVDGQVHYISYNKDI